MTHTIQTAAFSHPILVVEDNLLMRKLLEGSLQEAGYEVVSATNGREALALYEEGYYPIIVTDWIMPEIDGLELCRAIRSRSDERNAYIILMTSQDAKENMVTGLEAGADEYLIKPVNQAELNVRLRTARRILDLERSLKNSLEEIKNLSLKDPLTGLYNRRYLNERLPQEIGRAYRYDRSISLIMLDIDHFKEVNDRYGHHVGDRVLQGCADCINGSVRNEVDWLARYGGEEFVLVLPETDLAGSLAVGERLRRIVGSMVTRLNDREIRVTASFGVATISPNRHKSVRATETLIEQADRCLYEAKREGRNRVKGVEL